MADAKLISCSDCAWVRRSSQGFFLRASRETPTVGLLLNDMVLRRFQGNSIFTTSAAHFEGYTGRLEGSKYMKSELEIRL